MTKFGALAPDDSARPTTLGASPRRGHGSTCLQESGDAIRESTSGARGSFMLRSLQDPTLFITVARWDSIDAWHAFWQDSSRPEMNEMHALADRLSEEAFDEVADHTI